MKSNATLQGQEVSEQREEKKKREKKQGKIPGGGAFL
jgi:hypothetical protein